MNEKEDNKEAVPRIIEDSDDFSIGNVAEVSSPKRSAVESAMSEIEKIIEKKNRQLTHFLSIPINDKGIVEKFEKFKNEVLQMETTEDLTDYFQRSWKLHLTLGVLALSNEEKTKSALQALQECREIIDRARIRYDNPGDLTIKICGVTSMTPDPAKCRVVYGVVKSEILQTIANEIAGLFISKGLIEEDKNQVKLHVTMMNVVFVTRTTKNRIKTLDARAIVEKYSNFDFGEQKINEIHLSRFGGAVEFTYYDPECVLNLTDQSSIDS